RPLGAYQLRVLELVSGERRSFIRIMIAKHRVVLAFDVQVRVIARAHQRVNDFRPVSLAESGKPMLRHARMTNPVSLQQLPVDVGVLRVHVKNPWSERAEVRDRINELADQMTGVPFNADVLTLRRIEKPLP